MTALPPIAFPELADSVTPEEFRASLAYQNDQAAVGVVTAGAPRWEFLLSLQQSAWVDTYMGVQRFRSDKWLIGGRNGANLSRGRNELVRLFLDLDHRPEWLFMVDDDMAWDASAFEDLLRHAKPDRINGALCFAYGPDDRVIPTIFGRDQYNRQTVVPEGWEIPRDKLVQVAGTGAAFLLVHREAFETIAKLEPEWMRDVWFREEWMPWENPEHDPADPESLPRYQHYISEDLFFCEQARRAGLTVWVDPTVEVRHCKEHWLTRSLYEADTSAMVWAK